MSSQPNQQSAPGQNQPGYEENETTLWTIQLKTNMIAITNWRIIVNDYSLLLQDISDVIVLNSYLTGTAQYTGYSVCSGYNVRIGVHNGTLSGKSKNVGDIVIISPTQTDIILRDVSDPKGVRDLILALRKNVM